MSTVPEVIGYVLERHLPANGQVLQLHTTDPCFTDAVALMRLSEHEAIVDGLDDELNEEKLRRQDEQAKAAGKATRQTFLLRAALAWFEQHGKAVYVGAGQQAVDTMNNIAQEIRDGMPASAGQAGGPAP